MTSETVTLIVGIALGAIAVFLIGREAGRSASDTIHAATRMVTERERADDRIFLVAEQARGEFTDRQIINLAARAAHAQRMSARPLAVAR